MVCGMSTDSFPFVEVPEELYPIVGAPKEGTRTYRKDGPEGESGPWFEVVNDLAGPCVSPGGVSMYCPVSRAAVYKRMTEGRLSAFLYHPTQIKVSLFGNKRVMRESAYAFVPVSEAKAWKAELEERALRMGKITKEELEGSRPDWTGEYLEWRNESERYKDTLASLFKGKSLKELISLVAFLLKGTDYEVVERAKKKKGKR